MPSSYSSLNRRVIVKTGDSRGKSVFGWNSFTFRLGASALFLLGTMQAVRAANFEVLRRSNTRRSTSEPTPASRKPAPRSAGIWASTILFHNTHLSMLLK